MLQGVLAAAHRMPTCLLGGIPLVAARRALPAAPVATVARSRRTALHPCSCSSSGDSTSSSENNGSRGGTDSELPPELQGLSINDQGLLVDERTGEVINEQGATRFDVAVRALRGDFDPAPGTENTDRVQGVLLGSLVQFPCEYIFQVVARGVVDRDAFVQEVSQAVSRVCQAPVGEVDVRDRMNGKYVSVKMPVEVRAPELVAAVLEELGVDERIIMKY